MNALKTVFLLSVMGALLIGVGGALGGSDGAIVMFFVSIMLNMGMWFFSGTLALKSSGAQPFSDPRFAWLEDDVAELAKRANIPMPKLYWVPGERTPNAFATGRSPAHGVVAVTQGLLETLDRQQIRGVIAHELSHIKHRDTLIMTVVASIASVISLITRFNFWFGGGDRDRGGNAIISLLLMLLAPFVAMLLQLAISRTREYAADASAAEITRDPNGLASALEAISGGIAREPMHIGNESVHYIADGFRSRMGKLFSTHPPTDERIRRLRAMRVR